MTIKLSDHFTYRRLLRFTVPSIAMMIFTSIYSVVDGFFVSNFAGKTAFAAVNFIMPLLMFLGSPGFMMGTGGSALVAKFLGEKRHEDANRTFSMLVYVSIGMGLVLTILAMFLLRPVAYAMGARDEMLDNCVLYGRIVAAASIPFVLQMEFQSLFVTAEKPHLGLVVTVAAGVTNMVLDALFVGVFRWGLAGAAAATAISEGIGGLFPLIYFSRKNNSLLKLVPTRIDWRIILKVCGNGSSELMSSISMSLVGMLYNVQLMQYAGENGVSAYGVLMYVSMIFSGAFIGYAVGTAPVISYHYGAQNRDELKSLLRKSSLIIAVFAAAMFALSQGLAHPLAKLFVGYDAELMEMTEGAFRIYSFSFLFMGFSIFASSFFTALNNGLISALISFLRTLLFQSGVVLLLPLIWGLDGIWISIVVAEVLAVIMSGAFIAAKREKYGYA
ncbi:MAG: MATE family efflux transporter [Clostridia bacterium]|nr:MATE family efflux transporter [Clostridia bacterium]